MNLRSTRFSYKNQFFNWHYCAELSSDIIFFQNNVRHFILHVGHMPDNMPDEKRKISVRIPVITLESVRQLGYYSPTEAIIKGLDLLISKNDQCDNCKTAPDNSLIQEHQIEIEFLRKEINDLKSIHNNYMIQVQTILNQKTIEAPGAKKPWWRF
jgi:hypothetical protein